MYCDNLNDCSLIIMDTIIMSQSELRSSVLDVQHNIKTVMKIVV